MRKLFVIGFLLVSLIGLGQGVIKTPVCYGEPIALICNYTEGCPNNSATYHWKNFSGSWTSTSRENCLNYNTATPGMDIGEGYASDKFYLWVQFAPPPGGFYGGRVVVTVSNTLLTKTSVNPTCVSPNSGSITLSITGGVSPYTYLWSDGNTNKNRTGLHGGNYTVTSTDAGLCTKSLLINLSVTGSSLSSIINDARCRGHNGSIYLNTTNICTGDTFSYLWSNGYTTKHILGLDAGTYTVTVTDNSSAQYTLSNIVH